jgi:hypothetical protein
MAGALSSTIHPMTQTLFVIQTPERTTTLTLSADGWLLFELEGFVRRRWLPSLPQFLQARGFLEPHCRLTATYQQLSSKLASILGFSVLLLIATDNGAKAVAIVARRLVPAQCAGLFQSLPHVLGVAHAEAITPAPPLEAQRSPPPFPRPSIPEFMISCRCKSMLPVVDNLEDGPWL